MRNYEYEVRIFIGGVHRDTVHVEARDENEAMDLAMYQVSFGAKLTEQGRLGYEEDLKEYQEE